MIIADDGNHNHHDDHDTDDDSINDEMNDFGDESITDKQR